MLERRFEQFEPRTPEKSEERKDWRRREEDFWVEKQCQLRNALGDLQAELELLMLTAQDNGTKEAKIQACEKKRAVIETELQMIGAKIRALRE